MKKNFFKFVIIAIVALVIILATLIILRKPAESVKDERQGSLSATILYQQDKIDPGPGNSSSVIKEAKAMPVYGHWRNFTTKVHTTVLPCMKTGNGAPIQRRTALHTTELSPLMSVRSQVMCGLALWEV
jgi:hypothetical protein